MLDKTTLSAFFCVRDTREKNIEFLGNGLALWMDDGRALAKPAH